MENKIEVGSKVKVLITGLPMLVAMELLGTDFFNEVLEVHDVVTEDFQYAHPQTSKGDASDLIETAKERGDLGKLFTILIPADSDFSLVAREEALVDGHWELIFPESDLILAEVA